MSNGFIGISSEQSLEKLECCFLDLSAEGECFYFWETNYANMNEFVKINSSQNNQRVSARTVGGGLNGKIIFHNGVFEQIISLENLFLAWTEFQKGKRGKSDVQAFELHLEDNIFALHEELAGGIYRHGGYHQFRISDPKPRLISKASVWDRLLHHAIYRILYPTFDKTFIYDSYSCRKNKGTHKAFFRLVRMARKVSRNYTSSCWALKLDIRKFFDSVDHEIMMGLLRERIADERLLELLKEIIFSFSVWVPGQARNDRGRKGMPLGNLTSQLFANIYLDPLDKFVKHQLKTKHYLRYADDFIFLSDAPDELMGYLLEVRRFWETKLKLNIHPNKIFFRKLKWGIDYVGYVVLPHHNLPRKKTVIRIFKNLKRSVERQDDNLDSRYQSYLGYLSHVDSYRVQRQLEEMLYCI